MKDYDVIDSTNMSFPGGARPKDKTPRQPVDFVTVPPLKRQKTI